MEFVLHLAVFVCIQGIVAIVATMLMGFAGIGAYVGALVAMRYGLPFPLPGLAGAAVAAGISLMLSVPTLRLRGDYMAIATLGFQFGIYGLLYNWNTVTGGAVGLRATAMMTRPKLLFVDEPLIGVSPVKVQEVMAHLRRISRDFGTAILLIEQNVRPALEVADRACSRRRIIGTFSDTGMDATWTTTRPSSALPTRHPSPCAERISSMTLSDT